jgi:predicted RNA polymerase sigma factor
VGAGTQPQAPAERAVRLRRPGEYQLQAAITALQIQAPAEQATDWAQIAERAKFGVLSKSPSLLRRPVEAAESGRRHWTWHVHDRRQRR